MNLSQKIAGIPIDLPGWTQFVAYAFLALLTLLIGVLIWRGIQKQKGLTLDGETHAKVSTILLMLRNWSERGQLSEQPLPNEHYASEPLPLYAPRIGEGSHRVDDTDDHGRLFK